MRKLAFSKNLSNQNTPQVEHGCKFSEWNFYEDIHLAERLTRFTFTRPTHLPRFSTQRRFVVQESAPERIERKINKNIVYLSRTTTEAEKQLNTKTLKSSTAARAPDTENLFSHFESIEEYRTASATGTTWS